MAKKAEEVVRDTIGDITIANCQLQAAVLNLQEQLTTAQNKIAELSTPTSKQAEATNPRAPLALVDG